MDINVSKNTINNAIEEKKIERSYDVMDVFSITPELTHGLNMHSPQIAAAISSIPGATLAVAVGAVSLGAIYTAVIERHYLTKDIRRLRSLRSDLSNPELMSKFQAMTEEEFEEEISNAKHL